MLAIGAEEFDAVYTWVDGADPAFQAALRRYSGDANAARAANRYRCNGELRFSLRSLFRHAPWIRNVYILTNGQAPRWLDRSHARIRIITHVEIFPESHVLPTFNSHAIELCLHRIPGLSRRFLYLNDDFFLGRDVHSSDFFLPDGGQVDYVVDTPVYSDPDHGSAHDRACAYTHHRLGGRRQAPRLLPAHAPQPYNRDVLCRLEGRFQQEFSHTLANRFRSPDDVVLNVLYAFGLLDAGVAHRTQVLPDFSREYRFFMLERRWLRTMHAYVKILWQRPRFLCMNDDLESASRYHPLLLSLKAFLRLYIWRRAPVELGRSQTFSSYPPSQ
jgi:hypothetical protein